jgi:intracellular septation protein
MYFLRAIRPIANDFLSTIIFVAFYAITGDIRAGIVLGIAVGIGQIAYIFWRGRRPDLMQWASLALVVVMGSASLLTHDPRFVMVKPSIGAFAISCVMLRRGWMARYLPSIVKDNVAASVIVGWGYVWSAVIFTLAFANLFVALTFGPKIWAWYTAVVPIAAQLGLFLIQYTTLRFMVVRNIRTRSLAPAPAE